MSSDQTFSDIQTPEFMLEEINRLLGDDVQPVEEYATGETTVRDDSLFLLMHETQEEYEAAQRAALGIGRSQFDIDPYATTSTYDILNHSVDNEQYASSSQQTFSTGDFNNFLTQPLVGWEGPSFGVEQDFMSPYAQCIGGDNYSDTLDVALSEGGSDGVKASSVDVQDDGEVVESSIGEYLQAAYGEHNQSERQITAQNGNALPSSLHAYCSAVAEEPGLDYANQAGTTLSVNDTAVVNASNPVPGDTRDVPTASRSNITVGPIPNERFVDGSFHVDFDFALPRNTEGDRGVGPSDIASTLDVSITATNKITESERGSGSDDAKDVAQETTSNVHSDNKENEADEPIHAPETESADPAEATVPLESSSSANVIKPSKGKQPETDKSPAEKDTSVTGAGIDVLKAAPTLFTGSETSKPIIGSTARISNTINPAKRKATTTIDPPARDTAANTAGTSKAKQPPNKKVRLAKDEVPAARSSGILTCDECLKSPVHDDVPTFNRKADLNRHIRTVHELLEQLTCPNAACVGATFSKRSALNRHKRHFGH